MKKILVIICLLICSCVFANEQTFITDNYNGKILLTPEYIIKVFDYDVVISMIWLPTETIIITNNGCVININTGEKVDIESINLR